ncbi:MAG: hypothetical protein DRJ28_05650 [Actinobacteria bacterium]|nr:MAG: hypothetical protein DRJ28_05650 [Actinomycetota bacterium]
MDERWLFWDCGWPSSAVGLRFGITPPKTSDNNHGDQTVESLEVVPVPGEEGKFCLSAEWGRIRQRRGRTQGRLWRRVRPWLRPRSVDLVEIARSEVTGELTETEREQFLGEACDE